MEELTTKQEDLLLELEADEVLIKKLDEKYGKRI